MQRPLRFFLLLLLGLAASACTGDRTLTTAPAHQTPGPRIAPDAVADSPWRAEFERAAAGLWYSSEADYPFDFFFLPANVQDGLDPVTFRALLGLNPDTPVDERDIDRFFWPHIERVDPRDAVSVALVPRYERLKFLIEEALNDRRVYCVGSVLLRCYVVGTDESGNIVGLVTTALET